MHKPLVPFNERPFEPEASVGKVLPLLLLLRVRLLHACYNKGGWEGTVCSLVRADHPINDVHDDRYHHRLLVACLLQGRGPGVTVRTLFESACLIYMMTGTIIGCLLRGFDAAAAAEPVTPGTSPAARSGFGGNPFASPRALAVPSLPAPTFSLVTGWFSLLAYLQQSPLATNVPSGRVHGSHRGAVSVADDEHAPAAFDGPEVAAGIAELLPVISSGLTMHTCMYTYRYAVGGSTLGPFN